MLSTTIKNDSSQMLSEHEVVDMLNQLLHKAKMKRASDIHFEPYQTYYRIRMRIDGVLQVMANPPLTLAKQIAARLKIMAKLNIAEQRLPQDGQLVIDQYTMRIATLPVLYGEKIVLRVMDSQQQQLTIEQLGFSSEELAIYQQALDSPQGLILVTGPTGSGKTVTLYSGLSTINQQQRNICSIEDPIEMPMEGINQTQVNFKAGLNFAQTLRSFLRQDPDIIMVGEIRDRETAEIAVQAAQTGHLVLSTLHTNSSAEALVRLNQMGIENYLLASSLKLIIAQRLVRQLCCHCKTLADEPFIEQQNPPIPNPIAHQHFIAKGCEHCVGGYHGRVGIYEFLLITPQIQTRLLSKTDSSINDIQLIMQQQKVNTLFFSGMQLVKQGNTSLAEIFRVLGHNRLTNTE